MISFAFVATVLNYVHRLSFNYLSAKGHLRDLIPDDAFGYIATAFFVAYMISNGVSGFLIDKLGTRLGYSLCMAFWTTAAMLHALVRKLEGYLERTAWPSPIDYASCFVRERLVVAHGGCYSLPVIDRAAPVSPCLPKNAVLPRVGRLHP